MNQYIKTKEIADALHMSRKAVLEKAAEEGWICRKKGNALQFLETRLPQPVRFALSQTAIQTQNAAVKAGGLGALSDKARNAATGRACFLYEYTESGLKPAEFCEAYNVGVVCTYLKNQLGEVSLRTLYRWLKESKESVAAGISPLSALAPRYGLKKSGAGVTLTQTERDLLRYFWLKPSQPRMADAYRMMIDNFTTSLCKYQTAVRFLNSIPPLERDYFRLGKSRFENLYLPYVEQNIYRYKSLDMVVSDHHCIDAVVLYRGKLVRPWITTFQDYRSGKVLGWCPSVNPSSLSIIVAYYMCCIRYGVPREVLFDNGKDYRSKLLNGRFEKAKIVTPEKLTEETEIFIKGVFPSIGSQVHFTRVYSGKSKGRQERYYRVISEELSKSFTSYIGSDTNTRPEEAALMWRSLNGLAKRDDIPTYEYFVQAAGAMIELINDTYKSNGKGMDGKTRTKVFEENLPENVRFAEKEDLQQALYCGEVRKCGRNGIRMHNAKYYHQDLTAYAGQDVIVRNSLLRSDEVQVCRLDGTLICTASAGCFDETDRTEEAIGRVEHIKKLTLGQLAEIGTKENSLAPEKKTQIDVALRRYGTELSGIDELLGIEDEPLAQAAGAETTVGQSKYLSPLDAATDVYYHLLEDVE